MFSMIFKEFFSKLAEIDKNIIKCQKSIRWNNMNSFSAQKYLSFETKRSFLALSVQEISIFKDYFSVNLFRKMAFFMKMAYFSGAKNRPSYELSISKVWYYKIVFYYLLESVLIIFLWFEVAEINRFLKSQLTWYTL